MKRTLKRTKKVAMEVGAGVLTAAALAAAAAYLLSSKKQRARAKAWATKARREVARNVRTARRMGEAEYKRIVDRATKRYGSLHDVNVAEIMKTAQDLKAEWKQIQKKTQVIAKMARKKKPARKKK